MAVFEMDTEHTLIEVAKRHGPDGNIAKLIDVLSKRNPLLEEGYWVEGNDFNSHQVTQILTEPAGTDSRINKGIPYETGTTKQVIEPIVGLESYNRIDTRVLAKVRDAVKYRSDNDQMHVRGMAKTFHNRVLYGNRGVNPDTVDGFMTRFNDLSDYADNLISAGGSGSDLSSVLVVRWGEDGVYFTYPRGGKKILETEDLKQQLVHDDDGYPYTAVVSHFILNYGLCLADPRCFQRICNIETAGESNLFDEDDLIEAINRLPDLSNTVIYVNKDVKTRMDILLKDKTNVHFTIENAWGRPMTHFQGIPVKVMEALDTAEDAVPA